ncbi:MAG: GtrA family protein [Treponema sp.]|nr:GtrA family protein [Treponema sp.]
MELKKLFVQFIKFGLVGFSTTLISYGTYSLLVFIGVPYLVANLFGFVIGTLNSFLWNSVFVFKKKDDEKRNPFLVLFKTFITYGFSNFVLSSLLLLLLIDKFGLSKYIAPVFVLIITVPLNFIVNRFWAYKINKKGVER